MRPHNWIDVGIAIPAEDYVENMVAHDPEPLRWWQCDGCGHKYAMVRMLPSQPDDDRVYCISYENEQTRDPNLDINNIASIGISPDCDMESIRIVLNS